MENKYYTPEISEFHFGFEYEWMREGEGATPWTKSSVTFNKGPVGDEDAWRNNDYRVKYLDKSDIEELGWKYVGEYSDEDKKVMSFQKGNWVLAYNFTLKKIFIFVRDYSEEPDLFGSARDVKVSGLEVKNKSELKKLIKNLKIGE